MRTPEAAHLTVHQLLIALEQGRPSEKLTRAALAHLRELCPECDRAYRDFEFVRARRRARRVYADAFRAAQEAVAPLALRLEAERSQARRELPQLLAASPPARLAAVEASRDRFRSPLLLADLIDEAAARRPADPAEAMSLLAVAAAIAGRLPAAVYGEDFVERLRTRVEAHRAETLRAAGERLGSELLWDGVERRRARWPPIDPSEAAELAALEAELRQEQGRPSEAERLLRQAERGYREAGDRHGRGRTLLRLAALLRRRGDSPAAEAAERQAGEALGTGEPAAG